MGAPGRQKTILAVLAAILAATLWVQRGDRAPGGASVAGADAAPTGQRRAGGEPVAGVRLDLLEATRRSNAATRNPFEFGGRAAPPVAQDAPAARGAPGVSPAPAVPTKPRV
jgi:hypothetical protein